ncbi:hypothetical protein EPUS_00063 [Endocarpon pusillum Z07020]|uniref:BZIP domain-containing protein n=1 Tax=Endocarpon pusillum (strain Z07020 / HMAS-L-300199) TaxID=1263415 RepID=U1GTC9_ENDPU|nr:uncharacterized protein EPUS_00063 [Endocarpon pusillum Z07020]ERF75271.1 hypothetical protein EPUS_00063 [Endocarpon pusillum Z07020]
MGLDTERASRVRENKRRSRARQKEYTADLEQKLRQLQRDGVQATIEIQLSARKVFQENKNLRGLLQHLGVDENTIKSWAEKNAEDNGEGLNGSLRRHCLRGPAGAGYGQANTNVENQRREGHQLWEAATSCDPSSETTPLTGLSGTGQTDISASVVGGPPQTATASPILYGDERPIESVPLPPSDNQGPCDTQTSDLAFDQPDHHACSASTSSPSQALPTPCKLLTHLAASPSADITQMPTVPDEEEQPHPDGVPCSRAYRMLMQYATTEAKLDLAARSLEEGCVKNPGPGGGCSVKNKTMWKALEDLTV